jgi:ADP-heptose:LPS heptosyltransferase
VLHPGSGSPRKNWPLTRFVELAVALRGEAGVEPVFTAGEADEEAAQALKRQTSFKVLEGCSVLELAGALSACDGYLGNDSGVTHLAAAAGAPVVALFGPTDPGLWGPQGENVRIVRALPAAGGPEAIPAAQVLAELLTCTNRGRAGVSPAENRSECATRAFPAASALPRIGGRSR